MNADRDIETLLGLVAALRAPETGCPWDLAQTFASIAPYAIEEAYEVADAIERGDLDDLKDELGDLLLQIVFHARMAEEAGAFDFGSVVEAITAKLIRRHPHVFADPGRRLSEDEVAALWADIKAAEKEQRALRRGALQAGVLASVRAGMPALARALALQNAAAAVGFDWGAVAPILARIREETNEVAAIAEGGDAPAIEGEIGDLLFAVVNLARHCNVDPDRALRRTNAKFERRFASIEMALAARGKTPGESNLAEMDVLWEVAKAAERRSG